MAILHDVIVINLNDTALQYHDITKIPRYHPALIPVRVEWCIKFRRFRGMNLSMKINP